MKKLPGPRRGPATYCRATIWGIDSKLQATSAIISPQCYDMIRL